MIRRKSIKMLVGMASAMLLYGCSLFSDESSYRFKMTVDVETPRGLKTGSSVMEISARRQILMTSETHPVSPALKGEAVAVDLENGPLFVLLQTPGGGDLLLGRVTLAFDPGSDLGGDFIAALKKLGSRDALGRIADLPRDAWPTMVRLRDIQDPKTVEKVDPGAVGVRRIRLEVTREPVSKGIGQRLVWLDKMEQFQYDGKTPFNSLYPDEVTYLRSGNK